jgi:hypothetical protein
MEAQVKNEETLPIVGCAMPLSGYTVAFKTRPDGFVIELSQDMWTDSEVCGSFQNVLAQSAQVFCWQCAMKYGWVGLSESEHTQREEKLSRCETWW